MVMSTYGYGYDRGAAPSGPSKMKAHLAGADESVLQKFEEEMLWCNHACGGSPARGNGVVLREPVVPMAPLGVRHLIGTAPEFQDLPAPSVASDPTLSTNLVQMGTLVQGLLMSSSLRGQGSASGRGCPSVGSTLAAAAGGHNPLVDATLESLAVQRENMEAFIGAGGGADVGSISPAVFSRMLATDSVFSGDGLPHDSPLRSLESRVRFLEDAERDLTFSYSGGSGAARPRSASPGKDPGFSSDPQLRSASPGPLRSALLPPRPQLSQPLPSSSRGWSAAADVSAEQSRASDVNLSEQRLMSTCTVLRAQVSLLANAVTGLAGMITRWASRLDERERESLMQAVLEYTLPCSEVAEEVQTLCGELQQELSSYLTAGGGGIHKPSLMTAPSSALSSDAAVAASSGVSRSPVAPVSTAAGGTALTSPAAAASSSTRRKLGDRSVAVPVKARTRVEALERGSTSRSEALQGDTSITRLQDLSIDEASPIQAKTPASRSSAKTPTSPGSFEQWESDDPGSPEGHLQAGIPMQKKFLFGATRDLDPADAPTNPQDLWLSVDVKSGILEGQKGSKSWRPWPQGKRKPSMYVVGEVQKGGTGAIIKSFKTTIIASEHPVWNHAEDGLIVGVQDVLVLKLFDGKALQGLCKLDWNKLRGWRREEELTLELPDGQKKSSSSLAVYEPRILIDVYELTTDDES